MGYISAILRASGHDVSVISPLAVGVPGFRRIKRPHMLGYHEAVLRHATAVSASSTIRRARGWLARQQSPATQKAQGATLDAIRAELGRGTDLLVISAYTMYRDVCRAICAEASRHGVPVLVGGPMFTSVEMTKEWLEIPGLSAVFVGEAEKYLDDILQALCGDGRAVPGLVLPAAGQVVAAMPLVALDRIPFPDYSDFPWNRYPNRIIPMMTGRGCGWGVCTFCSDVATAAGRTFRSRSISNVLDEMRFQNQRHDSRLFTFLDLKLNSNPLIWHGLIDGAQGAVPGCEWTASVHVNVNGGNGLGPSELKEARRAGLSRITTGLESASQNVLNMMARGTNADSLSAFVRYASEAGISVRMTSIIGYPGERPEDVLQTANFLSRHHDYIDRIVINRIALSPETPLGKAIRKRPKKYPDISVSGFDLNTGLLRHDNALFRRTDHFRAVKQMLRAAHGINRKPLKGASLTFEGVM
ncbi:B12-binding domain-containing radical SAM protein [Paracoccus sp. (in: a-proteobacteria)]|uniref:B12-binding domain-containing radical SAM protein n=1 Tax=Paracoccus sp. TaxID=267 RepID=UPI003A852168